MKNKKIRIFNFLLFFTLAFLTIYFVLKNNNLPEIIANIKSVNLLFIIIAFLCMFIYITCEALNIKYILKTLNEPLSFLTCFKYASVGFFFSSITPSSSGGQPLQVYFMAKDKVPITKSILTLLLLLLVFQIVSCILALIGFFSYYDLLVSSLGKIKYLMLIGVSLNILILIILLIVIFSKNTALKVLSILKKILAKLNIKNENFFKSTSTKINEYHECALYLKQHKKVLSILFLITLVQLISYHSIPYLIYLSLNLTNASYICMVLVQAVLYISISSLPFPGAMGVSEGSFLLVYKLFFPLSLLSSAMILYRGISYYLFVLTTGIIIILYLCASKLKRKG